MLTREISFGLYPFEFALVSRYANIGSADEGRALYRVLPFGMDGYKGADPQGKAGSQLQAELSR
jgi:hypothetical protein